VLSPLLYIIFTADLQLWCQNSTIFSYADDTSAVIEARSLGQLKSKLEEGAVHLLRFMSSNGLCMNKSKTALIVHLPKGQSGLEEPFEIVVDGVVIVASECEKLLGFHLSSDLLWKEHLFKLETRLRQETAILRRLKCKLPGVNLLAVFNGLILSSVRYGLPIYGILKEDCDNLPKELQRIQVLVNSALRICFGVRRRDKVSNKDLCERAKIDNLHQMTVQSIITLVWNTLKYRNNGLLELWPEKSITSTIVTRSQKSINIEVPGLSRTSRRSLGYKGAYLWNHCPADIKSLESNINSPKSQIRNYALSL